MRVEFFQELVIGGYTPGTHDFDAVIVGFYRNGQLHFCGSVRNGFVPASRRVLHAQLAPLEAKACPFVNLPEKSAGRWGQGLTAAKMKNCVWLRPETVAQFKFLEWTPSDHLRHPSFVAVRGDKEAQTVVKDGEPIPQRKGPSKANGESKLRRPLPLPYEPAKQSHGTGWTGRFAADQVMQSGGFRVVVLDLASVDPKEALRIPSATWFRFRRAAQESDAILLLLTKEPCARSSAACVLECSVGEPPRVQGVLMPSPHMAEVARQRTGPAFGRKAPGRATGWDAAPAWMRVVGG